MNNYLPADLLTDTHFDGRFLGEPGLAGSIFVSSSTCFGTAPFGVSGTLLLGVDVFPTIQPTVSITKRIIKH